MFIAASPAGTLKKNLRWNNYFTGQLTNFSYQIDGCNRTMGRILSRHRDIQESNLNFSKILSTGVSGNSYWAKHLNHRQMEYWHDSPMNWPERC